MTAYWSVHDVVVVGAGLFGAAIARECALLRLDVAIVERDEVAGGASSVGKVVLGDGLSIFGRGADLAGLSALAPHLVTQIAVEGVSEGPGVAFVVDVTRLTQLYVTDAVERGAVLLLGAEVMGAELIGAERVGAEGPAWVSPPSSVREVREGIGGPSGGALG